MTEPCGEDMPFFCWSIFAPCRPYKQGTPWLVRGSYRPQYPHLHPIGVRLARRSPALSRFPAGRQSLPIQLRFHLHRVLWWGCIRRLEVLLPEALTINPTAPPTLPPACSKLAPWGRRHAACPGKLPATRVLFLAPGSLHRASQCPGCGESMG